MSVLLHFRISRWKTFLLQAKAAVFIIGSLFVTVLCVPTCALISCPFWLMALALSLCDPELGRFTRFLDNWMDEDFTHVSPLSSVITTVTVDGHLTLKQLKSLFATHVLQAPLPSKPSKTLYPELKQYLTRFGGFRVWKNDPTFNIDNHIQEKMVTCEGEVNLSELHQEMMNKPYPKARSPWDVVLLSSPHDATELRHSVIAIRCHHVLADGKSILKLIVGCLGQKPLNSAKSTTACDYARFPFHLMYHTVYLYYKFFTVRTHPWLNFSSGQADLFSRQLYVAFSPKLNLADLKLVANRNKVTTSAVVMSLTAGAIRNSGMDLSERGIICGYPLPKDNHPEYLANHFYIGILPLPTEEVSVVKRLQQCNENFLRAKSTQVGPCMDVMSSQCGSTMYPLSKKLPVNYYLPMFLTNIAGDKEGFSVGGLPCSDFTMSVGTLEGVAGVMFCAISYKEGIRVGVTARASVLSRQETDKLAVNIAMELKILMAI